MGMGQWVAAALVATLILAVVMKRQRAKDTIPKFSHEHHVATAKALDEFHAEYRRTFKHGQCTKEAILKLYSLRDDALRHLYEMHMRLPNDTDKETQVQESVQKIGHDLHAFIQNAKRRGKLNVHQGPIDELYYDAYWRAANA